MIHTILGAGGFAGNTLAHELKTMLDKFMLPVTIIDC